MAKVKGNNGTVLYFTSWGRPKQDANRGKFVKSSFLQNIANRILFVIFLSSYFFGKRVINCSVKKYWSIQHVMSCKS